MNFTECFTLFLKPAQMVQDLVLLFITKLSPSAYSLYELFSGFSFTEILQVVINTE